MDYGRGGLDVPEAGGVLDRCGVLVLGCSSQLLLRRLDVSDVAPVERVAVRARTTPPTGSLRADVPGSRTHPAPPLVASCRRSVCSRCCSQLSRAPCTGGRAPVSGAFAAAALLATAFVAWELRWSHPCSTRASSGYRRSGTGRPLSRSSSLWRHVTMVQRRSGSLSLPPRPFWLRLVGRAGYVPGRICLAPGLGFGLSMLVVGWGSAARRAWSRRLMTRSLVSGNRWP